MKSVKLTILFKSGVEKSYLIHDVTDSNIEAIKDAVPRLTNSHEGNITLAGRAIIIRCSEIASAEIEVIEQ